MMRTVVKNLTELTEFSGRIAEKCAVPACIALYGDLGAGKTEFARAFIRKMLKQPDLIVPSPTFTIVQYYEIKGCAGISHFDLYRLKSTDELEEVGFFDALKKDIVIIEWPERAEAFLPKDTVKIHITPGDGESRILRIE